MLCVKFVSKVLTYSLDDQKLFHFQMDVRSIIVSMILIAMQYIHVNARIPYYKLRPDLIRMTAKEPVVVVEESDVDSEEPDNDIEPNVVIEDEKPDIVVVDSGVVIEKPDAAIEDQAVTKTTTKVTAAFPEVEMQKSTCKGRDFDITISRKRCARKVGFSLFHLLFLLSKIVMNI